MAPNQINTSFVSILYRTLLTSKQKVMKPSQIYSFHSFQLPMHYHQWSSEQLIKEKENFGSKVKASREKAEKYDHTQFLKLAYFKNTAHYQPF